MESKEQTLNKLVEISKNLEKIDFDDVKVFIKKAIEKMPVPTAILRKGALIDRARVNNSEILYMKERDISYIKDKAIIEKFTEYGRANKPKQVMFYGAIESPEITQQRITAIFETSRLLKDKKTVSGTELITVSRWEVLEDITLAEVIFSDKAIQNNNYTNTAFQHHFKQFFEHEDRELILQQLIFFSNEFAKKVGNDIDYKISVAYTDIILNGAVEIEGIAYPSVASGYKGQNVVLRPNIIDTKLKLQKVVTQKIVKDKNKVRIDNDKYVKSFGLNNSSFEWIDIEKYLEL